MTKPSFALDRREFLGAAAATGITLATSGVARSSNASSTVELGLIGCGGRGNFIANLVNETPNGKVVAVCDYFQDHVDQIGDRLKIDRSRRFVGLDGYQKMVESQIDGILVESPPYFHPTHAIAGLEHGKHVYLAKPISVDVPGSLAIVAAAEKVKDKLTCWVDFQTRRDQYYQGAAERLFAGSIGKPYMAQAYYYSDRLGLHCQPGGEPARLRNWVFDKALSGDIIVEQNIHTLDVCNWLLQGHPIKAHGTGGRSVRTDVGDCWDHFVCTYWYPNDVVVSFSSRQCGYGPSGIVAKIFCETGTVETNYAGAVHIKGQHQNQNYAGGSSPDLYRAGAAANIKLFLEAVQSGKPINNTQECASSTMTAILGRTAAYGNTLVTWDELLAANQKIDAKLQLPENGPSFTG